MEAMSESRSSAQAADDERELERIAGELYALRPDDFAAARDEQVRAARAEGQTTPAPVALALPFCGYETNNGRPLYVIDHG